MQIDSYSFGSMVVDGKQYSEDLIIFPDRVRPHWWRKEGHSLSIEDLDEVIDYKPELLIVGKGASGCMSIPTLTRNVLKDKQIEIIDKNTDEASQIFNEQIKKGKKVVGAFHLTC